MIPLPLLESHKARLLNVAKDHFLITEGEVAANYFQVEEGQIKMFIVNPDGQEFMQGIFGPGESFGEPALLGAFPYPSNAVAIVDSKVWKLTKENFLQLLKDNFEVHIKLDQVLCKRLQYKSILLTEVSSYDPEHRLMTVMKYFKSKQADVVRKEKMIVPFTRQQLADMTGLRVETVIRTVKKMEKDGKLKLEDHKIKF
jgi:CRP/FNR family transcriptional regulator, cyclic AMP receptor protein